MLLLEDRRFYVYVYLDPRKPGNFVYSNFCFAYQPFYVGKGCNYRMNDHLREASNYLEGIIDSEKCNKHKINTINKIKRELHCDPIILKVKNNLTDFEACELEKYSILTIGRNDKEKGPLTNLTDGGEGSYGRILSQSTKEKISIAHIGKKASETARSNMSKSQKGRKHSKETLEKMSKAQSGENNGMYGKKLSPEHAEALHKANRGKKRSPEAIEKTRKFHCGRKRSKEVCDNISKSLKGRKASEEAKANMRLGHKNRPPMSEETKQKHSYALKGRIRSEEHCKNISKSLIGVLGPIQKENCRLRNIVKEECFRMIKEFNLELKDLKMPSNHQGLKKWNSFKEDLIKLIES